MYSSLIYVHLIFAISAIFCGTVAMIAVPKGNKLHKLSGRAYFYSYLLTCTTAFLMLTIKFKSILMGLTVMNMYILINGFTAFTGFQKNKVIKLLLLTVLLLDILFLASFSTIQKTMGFKVIFYFYIVLMIYILITDTQGFFNHQKRYGSIITFHMEKMLLSFIALAGGVVIQFSNYFINQKYSWATWTVAYIIGIPLTRLWIYRRQKEKMA